MVSSLVLGLGGKANSPAESVCYGHLQSRERAICRVNRSSTVAQFRGCLVRRRDLSGGEDTQRRYAVASDILDPTS